MRSNRKYWYMAGIMTLFAGIAMSGGSCTFAQEVLVGVDAAADAEGNTENTADTVSAPADAVQIVWESGWTYAENSLMHSDPVTLYHAPASNGIVVAVNAGHGPSGGESQRTLCHPDGTPKVTGGSTAEGEVTAPAVSTGMQFLDGTMEADANLSLAIMLKDILLERGYDVLMIRENTDTQLDNIARTVFANENAACHLALHYDSTDYDKGCYYMSVPDVGSYRDMEPVASLWEDHEQLGECLIQGLSNAGVSIFESGSLDMDLTQTSYSTVPSVDLEVGDRASDHSQAVQSLLARAIADGINLFFSGMIQ